MARKADPIEEFDRQFHARADITQKGHRDNGFSDATNPVTFAKSKDMSAIYQAEPPGKLVPLKDRHGKAMRGETRTGNAAAILVADIFAPPAVSSDSEHEEAESSKEAAAKVQPA
jgi:hypothetical protein